MTGVALCGVGRIGRVHLRSLQSLRGCSLRGVYDTDANLRMQMAADAGIVAYQSYDQLLTDPAVDAVVLATPASTHRELTERALRTRKHVFVEKPLAETLEDAQKIVDAAAQHADRVVQAGFCERFNPNFLEAKHAIGTGRLGKLSAIQSSRVAPLQLSDVTWKLGVLDTAVHNFDLILWLMGRLPRRVLARGARLYGGNIPHTVTTLMEFEDGALATDLITWLDDSPHPLSQCARARLTAIGDRGSFDVDLTARPSAMLTADRYEEIDTVIVGGEGYYGCLKLQLDGFLRSLELGLTVVAPVADAYRAEQVALAASASLSSGDWVELS